MTALTAIKYHSTKSDGSDNSGGKVFTYAAGTTTPQATYTTRALTTPNTNPVILDSTGRASIYLDPALSYKFVVTDSADVVVPEGTVDSWVDGASQLGADLASSAGGKGSELVGFVQSGTGAQARNVQAKLRDHVSVFDFMTTAQIADVQAGSLGLDVTAPVQAAIDSGATRVFFPRGAYKVGQLVLPNWMHLVGETMPQGIGAGDGPVRLVFNLPGAVVAIQCAANPIFENITFKNAAGSYNDSTALLSGTLATAIKTNGDAQFRHCNFYYWYVCIEMAGGCYYLRSDNVEFARCTTGYSATTVAPYDVHISQPTSRLTAVFLSGNATYLPRNVKVFGGSIEGYSNIARYFADISFFGTYFETVSARAGAFAIDPLANGAAVSLFGCLVYMDHTARFVNMTGLSNMMLTSHGNVFDGIAPAASYVFYLPDTGGVSLHGDRFGLSHPNDCRYLSAVTYADVINVQFPKLPATNVQAAYSGTTYFGSRGLAMAPLTAAPSAPYTGLSVIADGVAWDPVTRAAGRPYWVIWQGDRWRAMDGGV